jgi:energy-coupling factor transporter ATP-binding protein EcfA2
MASNSPWGVITPGSTKWSPDENTRRLARISTEAPRIPWDDFRREVFKWKAGEHVSLIGPTGLGKTTMLLNVLPMHPFVTVFATKPRDKTMDALIQHDGYVKFDRWPNGLDPVQFPKRVIWPDATQLNSQANQKAVFHDAFGKIYREGSWTLALDETWYVDDILGLGQDIKMYLLQARSLDVSLVAAFQRPAWVPRELYSSSTHLMFWRTNDETDLRSLSGVGFRSAALIRDVVSDLDLYQVLYINSRTGFMCRTRCPNVQLGNGREGRK